MRISDWSSDVCSSDLKKKFYWPSEHNDVVRRILKRARRGPRIIYIPGNHDEMFRQFTGLSFGGVEIRRVDFKDTADGRRLMVLHGDEFYAVIDRKSTRLNSSHL